MFISVQGRLFEIETDKYSIGANAFYPQLPNLDTSLLGLEKPRNRKQVIERAIRYVWEVGLLYRIIKMQIEFVSAGFKMVHEDSKLEKFYHDIYEKLDIETFIKNAAFYHFTVGEWYPYVSWKNNDPLTITLLNPKLVKVKSAFGKDFIYYYPSNDLRKIIEEDDEAARELKKIIPRKFINKWERGEPVYLKDSSRYANLKEYSEKYAHSPLEPIFADLEIIKTLQEADYSTAQKLKQLLLHIKIGNKDFNSGEPVPKEILDQTRDYWENPSRTMNIYTQWFVEGKYITPDLKIFEDTKYEAVVNRILQWSGMTAMFTQEGSYSEAYIKVKGLKQTILNARQEIKKALNAFNKEIAKRNGLTYYKELKVPRIYFSKSTLDDPKDISKMTQYLYNQGVLSIETLQESAGYDFKVQMKKKDKEKKLADRVYVHHEPNQGMGGVNKQGKEEKGDSNSQPRPSQNGE